MPALKHALGIAAIAGTLAFATALPAAAQAACPAGRTLAGTCANAAQMDDLRLTTIIFAQPKISFSAPPLLPQQDGDYSVPRDRGEVWANHHYHRPGGFAFGP
ncbi:MAG: hypothetical protein CFE31_02315 [Rhizobiales bacterium PAR1]|nr:MAG: hypothetical protein CFE31_02315 [Rhizobiales bacterium PAR1]